MLDAAVIGGGISGLTVAYELQKSGMLVRVFEKERKVGGKIRKINVYGESVDIGPLTIRNSKEAMQHLLKDLNLDLIYPDHTNNLRYIWRNGCLVPFPTSPKDILRSRLLSLKGKARAILEVLIQKGYYEETLEEFVKRRFGKEVCDYIFSPFSAGMYGAEPKDLSASYALSEIWELEQAYGSVLRGARKRYKNSLRGDDGKIVSFQNGIYHLVEKLHSLVCCQEDVEVLDLFSKRKFFEIYVKYNKTYDRILAKQVILTTPSYISADILKGMSGNISDRLKQVRYSPMVQVVLVGGEISSPNAFGILVPSVESKKILGIVFNTKLFPHRFNKNVYTVFIGGSRNPDMLNYSDEKLVDVAKREMHRILGSKGLEKAEGVVARWKKAIPLYEKGYGGLLYAVQRFEAENPFVFLCGDWIGGISVPDTIANAIDTARRVLQVA